jgi:hypothetical protein
MAGFITGEGCFFISVNKGRNKIGVGFNLIFQLSQHVRDERLLKSFISFFNCGYYIKPSNEEWGHYQCTKFSDIYNIIIPFCNQYHVRGIKAKDFLDWTKAAELFSNGEHLTKEGASKIISLKAGMNTGRKLE